MNEAGLKKREVWSEVEKVQQWDSEATYVDGAGKIGCKVNTGWAMKFTKTWPELGACHRPR